MRFAPKLASCALFVIAIVGASASRAQDYPTHPVRIIIGFGAGASADTPARLLAQKFSDALGQQFIVENKPGAGSNVAAEYVARAPNDGYTIFMATAAQTNYAGMTINPTYDVVKDFAPIVRVAAVPTILVANPSLGVSNLKELIALAKEKPGQIFYASSGVGTTTHVAVELINMTAGIKLVHVPYPGSAQALDRRRDRPRAIVDRAGVGGDPAGRRRQAQGHRRDHGATRQHRARRADHGGSGPARLRPRPVVRPDGAGRHAAADRRQARTRSPTTRSNPPTSSSRCTRSAWRSSAAHRQEFARYIDSEVKKATDVATAANIRQ